MSPQILKRQSYTSKCDVWSLGLILYEMIYGVTPWHSQNLVELMQRLDSRPLQFPPAPKISDPLRDLIKQCL
jgi:serine/threonine-protein kinase ULK/ATG1